MIDLELKKNTIEINTMMVTIARYLRKILKYIIMYLMVILHEYR
jgi:hypothetical protein